MQKRNKIFIAFSSFFLLFLWYDQKISRVGQQGFLYSIVAQYLCFSVFIIVCSLLICMFYICNNPLFFWLTTKQMMIVSNFSTWFFIRANIIIVPVSLLIWFVGLTVQRTNWWNSQVFLRNTSLLYLLWTFDVL